MARLMYAAVSHASVKLTATSSPSHGRAPRPLGGHTLDPHRLIRVQVQCERHAGCGEGGREAARLCAAMAGGACQDEARMISKTISSSWGSA